MNASSDPAVPVAPEASGQLTIEQSLDEGQRRRDRGQQAALLSSSVGWKALAERAIAELAATGQPFTAEDLRERVGRPLGSSDNCMGAVFGTAARAGIIEPIAYTQAKRPEAAGRVLRVWRGCRD